MINFGLLTAFLLPYRSSPPLNNDDILFWEALPTLMGATTETAQQAATVTSTISYSFFTDVVLFVVVCTLFSTVTSLLSSIWIIYVFNRKAARRFNKAVSSGVFDKQPDTYQMGFWVDKDIQRWRSNLIILGAGFAKDLLELLGASSSSNNKNKSGKNSNNDDETEKGHRQKEHKEKSATIAPPPLSTIRGGSKERDCDNGKGVNSCAGSLNLIPLDVGSNHKNDEQQQQPYPCIPGKKSDGNSTEHLWKITKMLIGSRFNTP